MSQAGRNTLPKRWLDCPRKALQLIGNRFMPLKTPLDERFSSQLSPKHLFSPSMFLSSMKSSHIKIGLWINLAFTDRFYDKDEIEKQGIKYVKLSCRGHGETPTDEQVQTFNTICSRFIEANPDSMIAVHCTHGFNRTGFLISAFLTQVEDWDLLAAVREFGQKRPPGIYKKDYLDDLFKRYGDMTDCPPPPELPDWCFEPEEPDEPEEEQPGPNHHRREFTKKDPTFMTGVGGTSPVLDDADLSRIRIKVQRFVGWTSGGFPGAQPVSMTRDNCRLLTEKEYMVSWKADGTRYMLLIEDRERLYFIDRDNSVFQIHGLTFPSSSNVREHVKDTLCDGEMVLDTEPKTGVVRPRFLIYDIIVSNGQVKPNEKIGNKDFRTRSQAITDQVIRGRHMAGKEGIIDTSLEPFGVRRKDFFDLSATEKVMKLETGHEHDGLIFQPVPDPYMGGTCDQILKWKPPHLNSIDFKCQIQKITQPGCLPQTYAFMYVGGHPPVLYSKTKLNKAQLNVYKEYDGKIVECTLAGVTGPDGSQWNVLRVRTDKSHPNSLKTADAVFKSIMEPVDKDLVVRLVRQICGRQVHQERRKGMMDPPLMPAPKHARI